MLTCQGLDLCLVQNSSRLRHFFIIKSSMLPAIVDSASGGSTTGPLGPGPQAPELDGAPKFSTNNFFRTYSLSKQAASSPLV